MEADGRVLRFAYNGILIPFRAAFPLYAIAGRLRGLAASEFSERLGRLETGRQGGVWIQAASVGEVGVAGTVLAAIQAARTGLPVVVTTTTRTGRRLADRTLEGRATVAYFPLDFPAAVRRAFTSLRPGVLVLVETELWPNLLFEAQRRAVPVIVVNGRISDNAFRRYRLVVPLIRRVLRAVRVACVQSDLDAERFESLGLPRERIRMTGNIKFSQTGPAPAVRSGAAPNSGSVAPPSPSTDSPRGDPTDVPQGSQRIAPNVSSADHLQVSLPGTSLSTFSGTPPGKSDSPSSNQTAGAETPGSRARSGLGADLDDEIWVAGSTAEGEEIAVLAAFDALTPPARGRRILVLAPRRPERFERVAGLLASRGGAWRRRSELPHEPRIGPLTSHSSGLLAGRSTAIQSTLSMAPASTGPTLSPSSSEREQTGSPSTGPCSDHTVSRSWPSIGQQEASYAREVVLLDTLGELPALYEAATVAFVGGSLARVGGHNLIEPAASGVAPIFGPHIQNTRDVASRLLAGGGAFQVRHAGELTALFGHLAADPGLRMRAGESARRIVLANAGALERTLREILPFLEGLGEEAS